jgi:hypothetical protein
MACPKWPPQGAPSFWARKALVNDRAWDVL